MPPETPKGKQELLMERALVAANDRVKALKAAGKWEAPADLAGFADEKSYFAARVRFVVAEELRKLGHEAADAFAVIGDQVASVTNESLAGQVRRRSGGRVTTILVSPERLLEETRKRSQAKTVSMDLSGDGGLVKRNAPRRPDPNAPTRKM